MQNISHTTYMARLQCQGSLQRCSYQHFPTSTTNAYYMLTKLSFGVWYYKILNLLSAGYNTTLSEAFWCFMIIKAACDAYLSSLPPLFPALFFIFSLIMSRCVFYLLVHCHPHFTFTMCRTAMLDYRNAWLNHGLHCT